MTGSLRTWTRFVEFLALITAPFVLLVAVVVFLIAGYGNSATGSARPTAARTIPTFNVALVTDDRTGRPGYIAFVPTDLTLPANSTVRIRITNFDDATAQKPAKYSRVWGTVGGTVVVQKMMPGMPNMLDRSRTLRSMSATTQVSRTFTSQALHLNVPIAASGVTTFLLRTGTPGHYSWRCMNP